MEIKQETKSLPRNRKCGNCRYFEPAPLWRKGWCRNPRLYDRRANHLVDAATIDCEQVFRARIYWEPVPTPETTQPGGGLNRFIGSINAAADGGEQSQPQAQGGSASIAKGRGILNDGVLRASRTVNNSANAYETPESDEHLPTITRRDKLSAMPPPTQEREKSTASPGIVAKPNPTRRWLIENIPYYDKIDGPISRITLANAAPWAIAAFLLGFVMLNVLSPKKDNPSTIVAGSTPSTASANLTPSIVSGATNKTNATPTATISDILPTATTAPTVAPTVRPVETNAKVIKVGPGGLNMRKEADRTSLLLKNVPEGKLVKIRSAEFKTTDLGVWWPVAYEGVDGWALSIYLEKVNP